MNKFARWLGYTLERFVHNVKQGRIDFQAEVLRDRNLAEVFSVLRADPEKNYIPAIKLYRQHFASNLKQAKDAVDAMRAQIG